MFFLSSSPSRPIAALPSAARNWLLVVARRERVIEIELADDATQGRAPLEAPSQILTS
jgi:hypothetical protein